jgi:hypothetical protein
MAESDHNAAAIRASSLKAARRRRQSEREQARALHSSVQCGFAVLPKEHLVLVVCHIATARLNWPIIIVFESEQSVRETFSRRRLLTCRSQCSR